MITCTKSLLPAWRATLSRNLAPCQNRDLSNCASAAQEARETLLSHFNRDGSFREVSNLLLFDYELRPSIPNLMILLILRVILLSNQNLRIDSQQMVYSLSFAGNSLESDFESDNTFPLIDDRMKRQLRNSFNALLSPSEYDARKLRGRLPPHLNLNSFEALAKKTVERKLPPLEQSDGEVSAESFAQPLPKSSSQIISHKLDEDARPIVVTDTKNPYRIVAVNKAWERLCGYSREECQGLSLGKLIQGPETNMTHATAMLSTLLAGEEAGAILINYAKSGRKFKNHIRVGQVVDEMGKTVNFVGVLREVKDEAILGNFSVGGRLQLPFVS
jgi:PAS domain S-box-containing protein